MRFDRGMFFNSIIKNYQTSSMVSTFSNNSISDQGTAYKSCKNSFSLNDLKERYFIVLCELRFKLKFIFLQQKLHSGHLNRSELHEHLIYFFISGINMIY